jgi:hypothetical protein
VGSDRIRNFLVILAGLDMRQLRFAARSAWDDKATKGGYGPACCWHCEDCDDDSPCKSWAEGIAEAQVFSRLAQKLLRARLRAKRQ